MHLQQFGGVDPEALQGQEGDTSTGYYSGYGQVRYDANGNPIQYVASMP